MKEKEKKEKKVKDSLDNKIWVENRIEDLKQELKDIVTDEIKKLDYKKTTEKFATRNKRIR